MSVNNAQPRTEEAVQVSVSSHRRRELDLLGMSIVLSLIFLHTASIFSGQQMVVNVSQSELTTMLANFVVFWDVIWTMPTMMMIAGLAVAFSLRRRTASVFLRERITRLLVPYLVGLILIFPPEVYYMLKGDAAYQQNFWEFLGRYFQIRLSISAFPHFLEALPPDGVLDNPSYLWFLIYLFVYTILLLPLFLFLRRSTGQNLVDGLAKFFARPWAILLLALPVAIVEGLLGSEWPGAWNRWVWPLFLFYGFLFGSDERFSDTVVRQRKSALALAIVGFLLTFMGMGMAMQVAQVDPFTGGGPAVAVRFIKGLDSWFWVVAVFGFATVWGRRQATQNTSREASSSEGWRQRLARYGQEAQLPFYVLHQTPIIIFGFYVVQWQMNPFLKFLIISFASLAVTLMVYEFIIRRTRPTRLLFGMRA